MYRRLLALASAALLATACDSTNPVAPPAPDDPGSPTTLTVTVASDRGQIEAGSSQAANLTVTAKKRDGSPAPDGTEVALNTNLGSFGSDNLGNPVQLVTKTLAGGTTTVQFFAGSAQGTANILAQAGTALGQINLPIVAASAPPVAEFAFEASGLSVLFEDASTGTPTAWIWDFGDGKVSTAKSPLHTYSAAGSYAVSLTVTAAGGQSTKRKFVTVDEGDALIANFTFSTNGLTVLFTDASAGSPRSYFWDFGDGKTSTAKSPSHTYAGPGDYTVTLTVANAFGTTDSLSKFVTLSLGTAPVAEFQFETDGLRALFTDASTNTPTRWAWDFGDGGTSTQQNPSHNFSTGGTYNVTLTASNNGGSSSKTKFVTVSLGTPPVASFEATPNALNVAFTDTSTNTPTSWSWEFGDGGTSTLQNPSHTYAAAGSYTVALTASNAAGSNRTTKVITVSASANPPVANFCYRRNGLAVVFSDFSNQGPTAWQWNFGDCSTSPSTCQSTLQNPAHTYAAAGTFAVVLAVSNSAGDSSISKFVEVTGTTVDLVPICL